MSDWNREELEHFIDQKESGFIYLYTPFCGTCQVSGKMLTIVEELLPNITVGRINLNYMRDLAEEWAVESVPCLVFLDNGRITDKLYAFQSVPYLVEKIKSTLN
ncbi:thioredoxin family protein [Bacillus sp. V3B]|uniref:thioredoxin family protein n=1 Tax=Bacillus sp. V3B TaxID=2804915 RepID=UPI00210D7A53|nr:thioredoxin family protein [Bacillus sp. V3B]MCQ6275620.1 thioredoxin family protein [Bacillus sp. V3B]